MGSVNGFLYQKLLPFASSFWLTVSTLFLALFGFLNRAMSRFKRNYLEPGGEAKEPKVEVSGFKEIKEIDELDEKETPSEAKEPEDEIYKSKETKEVDELEKTETPNFCFKFQFQSYRDEDEPVVLRSVTPASTSKYEFLSGRRWRVGVLSDKDFARKESETESVREEIEKTFCT
ncbi:hypothetical protein OIU79_001881 [Salix purpurea]|uniref:Uncharacterized protein n=1 Tax=Salix purpurea TaxID=77065 RepID=A0A9Q0ZHM6_SALPP|nr:hypothetical protein OIU79_001881 [Salix purpurea]